MNSCQLTVDYFRIDSCSMVFLCEVCIIKNCMIRLSNVCIVQREIIDRLDEFRIGRIDWKKGIFCYRLLRLLGANHDK